jgi:hypothetical protein
MRVVHLLPILAGLVACASAPGDRTAGRAGSVTFTERTTIASSDTGPRPAAYAPPPPPAPVAEGLDVSLGVYGWLASVRGTSFSDGERTDFSVAVEDLAERTKAAFQGLARIGWKGWFLTFDGTWATLEVDAQGRLVEDLKITIDQEIFDVRVGTELLRLAPAAESERGWTRPTALDISLGGRYFRTKMTAKLNWFTGEQTRTTSVSERWDPIVGLAFRHDLAERWPLRLTGDIGGFGIGNAARFTWQVGAYVGYRLGERFTLFGGWRVLHYDQTTGSGDDRNGTRITQHGPMIGFGFDL